MRFIPAQLRVIVASFVIAGAAVSGQQVHGAGIARPVGATLILREHATGGEVPAGIALASFGSLVVYDIATAGRSARIRNDERPFAPPKSPTVAFYTSFLGTAVPVLAGLALMQTPSEHGGTLIYAGLLAGPSVGHFYAGRPGRGTKTALARGGLTLLALASYFCCT